MADKTDRRSGQDRRANSAPEAGEGMRQRQRRMGDRRESPRLPIKLLVRYPDLGGSYEEREGDVGIGGVFFLERFSPSVNKVEMRFKLPALDEEVRCEGEIIRVSDEGEGSFGAHVRFSGLPVEIEMALARFIDDHELSKSPGKP